MRNILWIARDDGGCGFFRCRQPAEFIKRMGLAETFVGQNSATKEQLMTADLVIMQDMGSAAASDTARFCIEHRIPYVAEFDDFVHHVSPRNLGGYGAWHPGTLYIHRAMEMSRAAFAVQVSTPQLAREYFPYNPTVFVVPNYLDRDAWTQPIAKRGDGKIRIGWAGGNAHADDLHMISGVIEKLVSEFKGKVVFETLGMQPQELAGVFSMKDHKDSCPSCGFEGQIHHFAGEPIKTYPLAMASKGWDIAVAPVINNAFGNCKSDIKIKEFSALGLPVVASPIVPYREASKSGASILFAETFEEWYDSLRLLIKNSKKREEMSVKNKAWMEKNWIQENIESTYTIYEQLITAAERVLGKKGDRPPA